MFNPFQMRAEESCAPAVEEAALPVLVVRQILSIAIYERK
jgi:hypothetical protein